MIRIYNTLTKTKEEFKPVQSGKVGIYLCGPTVYKPAHIGHMVGPVIFDAIKRYLTYSGYEVTFIINITDVDDKLINEAKNRNMPMAAVAEEMTADYLHNLEAMGVKDSVNAFPKVSDHIGNIIDFVQKLIDKGFAYESDGDVYYDVCKFSEYGKLSHRSLDTMTGEGGSTADRKHTSFDFALWKAAKSADEPAWNSPWGKGRPGWHIECSAMSRELLGETFDIHGGGLDLVFPHHENEVAQSEARHGKPMCNFWMHNGLMQASNEVGKVGGRNTKTADGRRQTASEDILATHLDAASQELGKISKSKGSNAFSEMLKKFDPETIRFFLLSTHYRRPIDFSMERIEEVGRGLETFYRFFKRYEKIACKSFYDIDVPKTRTESEKRTHCLPEVAELQSKFMEAMDDDFNTGGAIGILFDLLRVLNRIVDEKKLESGGAPLDELTLGASVLRELTATLGLFIKPPPEKESAGSNELVGNLMSLLIELRAAARKNKDFATADKIRKALSELGIVLEDRPGGTDWSLS
jgi:cysteinyl-tRNA synthetase